jgi:hypothetical protein
MSDPGGGPGAGIERVGNILDFISWAFPRALIIFAILAVAYLVWSITKNRHQKKK